jgi:hypothetical protein
MFVREVVLLGNAEEAGVLRRSWFLNYFAKFGKKLAAGMSAGSRTREVCQQETCDEQIMAALADARFQYRTIPGIAAEIGIPEATVRSILEARAGEVRKVSLHDGNGNVLYTLRSRPRSAREILAETRASLAGSSR